MPRIKGDKRYPERLSFMAEGGFTARLKRTSLREGTPASELIRKAIRGVMERSETKERKRQIDERRAGIRGGGD